MRPVRGSCHQCLLQPLIGSLQTISMRSTVLAAVPLGCISQMYHDALAWSQIVLSMRCASGTNATSLYGMNGM